LSPLIRCFVLGAILLTYTPRTAAAVCAGDCNGDAHATVDELVVGISIALGELTVQDCLAFDTDGSGMVTVDEILAAVDAALNGCPDAPFVLTFQRLNLQPEGIEYDAGRGAFLVGSRTEGTVHVIGDDGSVSVLTPEPGLGSSLGLHIDHAGGRLLAAGAISAASFPPTGVLLGIYELSSGATIRVVDLAEIAGAGQHFLNDVTTDSAGNAYVTDTSARSIYRVTPEGDASLLIRNTMLNGANGIDIHDDRILIVAPLSGPRLVRVPIDAPESLAVVQTDGLVSGDGIVFTPEGRLAVVGGIANGGSVLLFESDDDWQSASLVGTWDTRRVSNTAATTAAVRDNEVFVIFAHLFDTTRLNYEIAQVVFTIP
jgi:sugar lactone lactonase YvrE